VSNRTSSSSVFKNYIGGEWIGGGDPRPNINPSNTDDVIGNFARASTDEVAQAVLAARVAFPAWSRSAPLERHRILRSVADSLAAEVDAVGRMLAREEGKTLPEAIGEVTRASQVFAFFAQECLRMAGEKLASARPNIDVEITREPIGVVGVITPWNFPIALPSWKIAAALAYGNCVIFKPAELTPGSAFMLTEMLDRAGVPRGVFNLTMGGGSTVGPALLDSDEVDAITFTGSTETGRRIREAATRTGKKVQLEMGGKNPLVVLDDADLKLAVECAVNGAFFSTGQRCTASSRLIVTDGIYDAFVKGVVERLRSLKIDDALKAGTDIGPVVDEKQLASNLRYVQIGSDEGARLVHGGQVLKRENPGFYMEPALFEMSNDMQIAREEIFGPVAGVVRVKNYEEALSVANDTPFGLSAGICTSSLKHATHFKRNAEAGVVMVNLPTAGIDFHVPFGGRKASSFGPREQGRYAAEFYTTVKTAYSFAG
jgi:acyl-CoA reductase-like NAD-dependent aldehyde dehydrogenase